MYNVNRNPISGEVIYNQYHKGKYLVAWHPKIIHRNKTPLCGYPEEQYEILVKQIAGALAKRDCQLFTGRSESKPDR